MRISALSSALPRIFRLRTLLNEAVLLNEMVLLNELILLKELLKNLLEDSLFSPTRDCEISIFLVFRRLSIRCRGFRGRLLNIVEHLRLKKSGVITILPF